MADDDDMPAETRHMALPVGIDVEDALSIELEFPMDGATVKVPVSITPSDRVGDLTRHVMDKFQLPVYLESTVFSLLQQQVALHVQQLRDVRDDELCNVKEEKENAFLARWVQAYSQERHDYVMHRRQARERLSESSEFVTEMENKAPFSEVFHDAIHSPLLVRLCLATLGTLGVDGHRPCCCSTPCCKWKSHWLKTCKRLCLKKIGPPLVLPSADRITSVSSLFQGFATL
jgi:hypothetical protein